MSWNNILFLVFPYFALAAVIVGTIWRFVKRPFSVSTFSSQLLENKKLFWGSITWHVSIILVLLAHLANFLIPRIMVQLESLRIGLIAAQLAGSTFGLLALLGMLILMYRRASTPRLMVVTTVMDMVVTLLLLFQVIAGLILRMGHFGTHHWFVDYFVPYFISVFRFMPQPELITGLPWIAQAHVFDAMLLLAILPFSRLIHIPALPLRYLIRPWLVVTGDKSRQTA